MIFLSVNQESTTRYYIPINSIQEEEDVRDGADEDALVSYLRNKVEVVDVKRVTLSQHTLA